MVFFPFFSDSLAPRFLFIGDIYIYIYHAWEKKNQSFYFLVAGISSDFLMKENWLHQAPNMDHRYFENK